MATHFSILAWRIPWTEEPGRLWFMGAKRVRYDSVTNTFNMFYLEKLENTVKQQGKVNNQIVTCHFVASY